MTDRSNFKRIVFSALGVCVLIYALSVIVYVSSSYELVGITTILTPHIIERPPDLNESEAGPIAGDLIVQIGPNKIQTWKDVLNAPRDLHQLIQDGKGGTWHQKSDSGQDLVLVEYVRGDDPRSAGTFQCELRRLPLEEMIPSIIWLFLKLALFVIGAFVYWKRPDDDSASRFYVLCVITLGAYIGGYHWTHIVTQPVLQIIFTVCAILLPVASLHFYLVFPHKKVWLERYPVRVLTLVYGLPLLNLAC
jgi:uncharacterized membrane protein YhaH (DUF805 family)